MSIIQEALKKSYQKEKAGLATSQTTSWVHLPSRKTIILITTLFLAVLLASLLGFALKQFLDIYRRAAGPTPHTEGESKIIDLIAETYQSVPGPVAIAPLYPKFALSGIMYLENGPRAIINGISVAEGDTLRSGAKVLRIYKDSVLVYFNGVEVKLELR